MCRATGSAVQSYVGQFVAISLVNLTGTARFPKRSQRSRAFSEHDEMRFERVQLPPLESAETVCVG